MRDYIFKRLLFLCSLLVLLICGGMVYSLVSGAVPAFEKFGFFHFISSVEWDPRPGNEQYGALAFITGTIMTSFLALVFCIPFSLPVALFTGEYFRGTRAATIIGSVIDLLAGIPSIVYGLWGFYTLRPFMVDLQLSEQGFGIFTAAVVLAVMIIPYASSLSAEFISMVPKELKEGAYSLGGTRLDVIRRVIFPVAGSGIFASYILALGRALGETMAVMMVVGNQPRVPNSILQGVRTLTTNIVMEMGYATDLHREALIATGVVLFAFILIINLCFSAIKRSGKE